MLTFHHVTYITRTCRVLRHAPVKFCLLLGQLCPLPLVVHLTLAICYSSVYLVHRSSPGPFCAHPTLRSLFLTYRVVHGLFSPSRNKLLHIRRTGGPHTSSVHPAMGDILPQIWMHNAVRIPHFLFPHPNGVVLTTFFCCCLLW